MTRIAVIGAGLSGLVVARELQSDHAITVFEKSHGFGGRMATRYEQGFEFDHGAQFFTARTRAFRDYLEPLIGSGIIATWRARFAELQRGKIVATRDWGDDYPHYVGAPRMNAIGKFLAQGLEVRRDTQVHALERDSNGWRLRDRDGNDLGRFDWVVLAMPAAQTAALVPADSRIARLADGVTMRACMALMLGFDAPLALQWQAALVRGADISWISVNSSKPGRPPPHTLVVHSTNAFADANIDNDVNALLDRLIAETAEIIGAPIDAAACCRLQRWRYANADRRDGDDFLIETPERLAACGDWFTRGRIEAAFLSGFGLARTLGRLAS